MCISYLVWKKNIWINIFAGFFIFIYSISMAPVIPSVNALTGVSLLDGDFLGYLNNLFFNTPVTINIPPSIAPYINSLNLDGYNTMVYMQNFYGFQSFIVAIEHIDGTNTALDKSTLPSQITSSSVFPSNFLGLMSFNSSNNNPIQVSHYLISAMAKNIYNQNSSWESWSYNDRMIAFNQISLGTILTTDILTNYSFWVIKSTDIIENLAEAISVVPSKSAFGIATGRVKLTGWEAEKPGLYNFQKLIVPGQHKYPLTAFDAVTPVVVNSILSSTMIASTAYPTEVSSFIKGCPSYFTYSVYKGIYLNNFISYIVISANEDTITSSLNLPVSWFTNSQAALLGANIITTTGVNISTLTLNTALFHAAYSLSLGNTSGGTFNVLAGKGISSPGIFSGQYAFAGAVDACYLAENPNSTYNPVGDIKLTYQIVVALLPSVIYPNLLINLPLFDPASSVALAMGVVQIPSVNSTT